MDDTPQSRQENELKVLTAIYPDDIQDLRTGSKWKPLNILISLKPQQGSINTSEVYAEVDLHIKCSPKYPEEIPNILLENAKGVSKCLLNVLHSELVDIAKQQKGSEMIFELCQYVQEYLHRHNKPPSKSLYHEMSVRRQKEEMQNQQAKKMEEDRQRQSFTEEVNEIYLRREEANYKSSRMTSLENKMDENETGRLDSLHLDRRKSSSNQSTPHCQFVHEPTDTIHFNNNGSREILRGNCLRHTDNAYSVYYGLDKESGENLIFTEWKIEIAKSGIFQTNKQIISIEQEFGYVSKFKHQNLALYHNFSSSSDEEYFVIQVLKEFIDGSNCRSLFTTPHINADIQFLKHIANGVLHALDYLHGKSVIHRNIKDSCVYINNRGIVKLSNYNIHQKVNDLVSGTQSASYSKKTDIFKFGTFLLGLLQGSSSPENDNINIPESIPSDLYDFLSRCLSKEERDRPSTAQLLNHQFFNEKPVVHFKLDQQSEAINQNIDMHNDVLQKNCLLGSRNQSRINTEFEFMDFIGEGAYGAVKKYRNKLDDRFYAIKRIKLNPKNKQLNKKIVREVQLLSRLNHENVVRYYNSWIETSEVLEEGRPGSSSSTISFGDKRVPVVKGLDKFTINDDIEALAPPLNAKVSITYDSKSQVPYEDSSSDSDTSDGDENAWNDRYNRESESDGIEFENVDSADDKRDSESSKIDEGVADIVLKIDYMYIQMEFCEKSTLRTAIDDNLYTDEPRVQRLFREILEGLAHIHQQGMIHRDLKPVNIFLDCNDHVKIGDFGLATTNLKNKLLNDYALTKSALESLKEEAVDESKTGHIGTTFYVAPEIDVRLKAVYNEKVDIYSLGIILFEMSYKSPATAMERSEILMDVRKKEIVFPNDYGSTLVGKHAFIIKWLLNHDASKRPTSLELLQSEHVPPPILEEKELMDLIRHTLNNPQSKGYKYLVASCFDQTFSAAQDITFDRDLSSTALSKPLEIYYEFVKQITLKVFRNHGGQNLATPLLMPNSKLYTFYSKEDKCVRLMTHSGGVVYLPYDLRVPFARYIAWNNISLFRRYSIERVYREKKVFGFIPRELYECAFDIVTPTPGNFMSDAEILCIVYEIITQLPVLKNKNIIIHLNHTVLLKTILSYFGLKTEYQNKFVSMFSDFKEGKLARLEFLMSLMQSGLSDAQSVNLIALLNTELDTTKITNSLPMITKKDNNLSKYAKEALQELKIIIETAQALGVKFDIVLTPGLMYNTHQFSGMICQFVCEFKRRKLSKIEVLAAGGRYDAMLSHYRHLQKGNVLSKDIAQSAVGISVSLDKIVQAIEKEKSVGEDTIGLFDVMVCSIGNKRSRNEKVKILVSLSTIGIRWTLLEAESLKEVEEYREELKVPHVVILKDADEDKVILRSGDKDRFQEKIFSTGTPELIEYIQKLVNKFPLANFHQDNALSRSDSKAYVEKTQTSDLSIFFYTSEKIPSNIKKRHENQILSQLSDISKRLVGSIEVLALDLEVNVIKTLVALLDFQTEDTFQMSVNSVIEKHSKHKKILPDICDEIYNHRSKSSKPFVILCSVIDLTYYRFIM